MATNKLETIIQGRHLHFLKRDGWEFVTRPGIKGIVIVLAITNDNEFVFVEQFRPPINSRVIELCAGLAGDIPGAENETLEDAARRELLEECGYHADSIEFLTEGPPAQGLCDEFLTFFKATELTQIHDGGGDHTEDITVHHVPIDNVDHWLKAQREAGKMVDPKIYAALYFLK